VFVIRRLYLNVIFLQVVLVVVVMVVVMVVVVVVVIVVVIVVVVLVVVLVVVVVILVVMVVVMTLLFYDNFSSDKTEDFSYHETSWSSCAFFSESLSDSLEHVVSV